VIWAMFNMHIADYAASAGSFPYHVIFCQEIVRDNGLNMKNACT